jgi:hypothetical protein
MTTVRLASAPNVAPLMPPMPVTMPSAGVLAIRSSIAAAAALRGHGQRAVFDEAAFVAQVGDVLARRALACCAWRLAMAIPARAALRRRA